LNKLLIVLSVMQVTALATKDDHKVIIARVTFYDKVFARSRVKFAVKQHKSDFLRIRASSRRPRVHQESDRE